MITIFKNVFAYCYSENIIPENTFSKAKYRNDLLSDYVKPDPSTQVFTEEEQDKIIELAYKSFEEHPNQTSYLGIALLFQCGLRVGELVALETKDYDKENKTLSINKSECRDFTTLSDGTIKYNGTIIGTPKKMASIRDIELTDEACFIIDTIIEANKRNGTKDNPYLFVYRNNRLQSASILKRIYNLCDSLDYARRSTHKIRKTVLTKLVNTCLSENIADISAIRAYAGHVDESTLIKNYLFSTKQKEFLKLTKKALQSKSFTDKKLPTSKKAKGA